MISRFVLATRRRARGVHLPPERWVRERVSRRRRRGIPGSPGLGGPGGSRVSRLAGLPGGRPGAVNKDGAARHLAGADAVASAPRGGAEPIPPRPRADE